MKEISIEDLAHKIKKAKNKGQPRPIFFLGAGASKTGDIPLAGKIIDDILEEYKDEPAIKRLTPEDKKVYRKVMECLEPYERNTLLKGYIDRAKINVTHIYLAQLLINEFAAYVLTVNFDNLMLRALSLFNVYPPTYDIAILNDLTTSIPNPGSLFYLHGLHHGLWLLNTEEEMDKVKSTVPRFFDGIKNGRPWIFIGYSGSDPIFEHIQGLGRFDNGLYWVGYEDHQPSKSVQEFLETPNTNAFHIRGYDSDAFMLKLAEELDLGKPDVLHKPFTALAATLSEINDIDDKEHFKGVKERLEIARKNTALAIRQFEEGNPVVVSKDELDLDELKNALINVLIKDEYNAKTILALEQRVTKTKDSSIKELLSDIFNNWGTHLGNLAQTKEPEKAEELYQLAFEKFQKAIEIKPDLHEAFNNWASLIVDYSRLKPESETENILNHASEILEKGAQFGDTSYNLACLYALQSKKHKAIELLDKCLTNKGIGIDHVLSDLDWKDYLEDADFKTLIDKHQNSV